MEKRWVHISILRGMVKDAKEIRLEYGIGTYEAQLPEKRSSGFIKISKALARRIIREHGGLGRLSHMWVGIQENIITLGVE